MTTKFYVNNKRQEAETRNANYRPYVPQYKLRGLEPDDFAVGKKKFDTKQNAIIIKGNADLTNSVPTFRGNSISNNVPFAEVLAPTEQMNLPNVGNNIENTWASFDNEIIDDIGLTAVNTNTTMIDNNEYINIEDASPYINQPAAPDVATADVATADVELQDDEYLLAIEETIIATGPLEVIEQQVKDLVFGEHELCGGKQIPVDDLIVLKRIKIKIGVFIDG